jgi:hypothetical protein
MLSFKLIHLLDMNRTILTLCEMENTKNRHVVDELQLKSNNKNSK